MHRTLLITHHFPPARGGAERYLENLARALPKDELFILAPPMDEAPTYDEGAGMRIVRRNLLRHTLFFPGWIASLPWFFGYVRQQKIARIVFGHYAAFVGLGLITKVVLGVPYVVSIFGLDFLSYRRTFVRRLLLRWNLRGAEWVTTISTHVHDQLRAFGVPEGKIVLAPPGIVVHQSTVPRQSAADFRRRFEMGERPLLLTVGRLVRRKGHARVIRALPIVLHDIPDLVYVVIGDGPNRPVLEHLSASLNLGDHVRFLGMVDERYREGAYHAAEAFIMLPYATRGDVEGFGIVFLEALAAGKPIIATRSGGVRDVVRDGVNGMALEEHASTEEVAAAITRFFTDSTLRANLSRRVRDDVRQRFSMDRQVRPFRTILKEPPRQVSNPPTVSVVIPAWNTSETLAKTLNSIATQTFKDLEIIVVDDGSTEDLRTVLRRFRDVRSIRQAHAGAPAARNRGFRESRGRYILFCDADVTLHPRLVERMVMALELKPEASYAYSSFRFGWRTFDLFDFDPAHLCRQNYISTMSLLRRAAFPGFDEQLTRLQDWDLWLAMLERGHRGVWVPARLFSASVGKRGMSRRIATPPADAVRRVKEKHGLI